MGDGDWRCDRAVCGLVAGLQRRRAGKLPITDFGGLGQGSGLKLLFAFVIAAGAGLFTFITIGNRVLVPVKRLSDFAERFAQGDTAPAPRLIRRTTSVSSPNS